MATDSEFAGYVVEQARLPHAVRIRKMFGEYALYLDDKVVALLCDNQVFVRPTEAGRALVGRVTEGTPFPGAKPHILVTELDDSDLLQRLLLVTADALPAPKPKKAAKAPATKAAATTAAKSAVKKTVAKKTTATKVTAKKDTAKKATAQKAPAKKPTAKKPAAKTSAARTR